jgi:hypothetical protein
MKIEKIKKSVSFAEKLVQANRIAEMVVSEQGVVNKNFIKLFAPVLFVGLYAETNPFPTDNLEENYAITMENGLDKQIEDSLTDYELDEWKTILQNAIDYLSEERRIASGKIDVAITRFINSLTAKIEKTDIDKMFKQIMKVIKDPNQIKNIEMLTELANKVK